METFKRWRSLLGGTWLPANHPRRWTRQTHSDSDRLDLKCEIIGLVLQIIENNLYQISGHKNCWKLSPSEFFVVYDVEVDEMFVRFS